jgi:KDO2-lipid IV(A) lauroyltransferase
MFWVWRLMTRLSRVMPLSWNYALANVGGDLAYAVWPRGRRIAKKNISRVIGAPVDSTEVRSLARASFRHYGKYLADFARLEGRRYQELERRIVFSNWDAVERAVERRKGTIFIGLHQGNWDVGMMALARRGYPMNVIVETFEHSRMNRVVAQTREHLGVRLQPMEAGVLPMLRALKRNEMLGILIDQPNATANVRVQFLNHWVTVPAGAAALALRTGASILAGGVIRARDNSYNAVIHGPVVWTPTGNMDKDVQDLTQHIMRVLEDLVRRNPEQWFVFRPLWAEE